MSSTQVINLDVRPSLLARAFCLMMGRASKSLAVDLSNHQTLIRVRAKLRRWDRAMRYTHLSWYIGFVMRRVRLGGVKCRQITLLTPKSLQKNPKVLLYVHGGGFFFRLLGSHARLAAALCRSSGITRAYIPCYRLAPEHQSPAALDDIVNVYKSLLLEGYSEQDIVMAGDSAGGGILLSTWMRLRELGIGLPSCGVLLSPVTDLTLSGASYQINRPHDPVLGNMPDGGTEFYHGRTLIDDPLVSPVFGDFRDFPPLLVQVGSHERLLDDSLRLQSNADHATSQLTIEVWNRMPHVWQLFPLPESRKSIKHIGQFVRAVDSANHSFPK